MKLIIPLSIFVFTFPLMFFAMNNEEQRIFLEKIKIKNNLSQEHFFDLVKKQGEGKKLDEDSSIVTQITQKNMSSCSVLIGGGGARWSYGIHNHAQSDSKIFKGKTILTVYALADSGDQKAFIGNPDAFFAFEAVIFKSAVLAVAVLQSSKKTFQFDSDQTIKVKELFSKMQATLNIPKLKTYWVKSLDCNEHCLGMILKPKNQSCIVLGNGEIINFKYP